MNWLIVGIGGAFGGVARFQLGKVLSQGSSTAFPIGTFFINISGALLLGVLTGMDAGSNWYLLFGDGFLGAYTTFSTFMYEGFGLFAKKEKCSGYLYLAGSLILGIIGYILGFGLGNLLIP